jgi:hypothetical protein
MSMEVLGAILIETFLRLNRLIAEFAQGKRYAHVKYRTSLESHYSAFMSPALKRIRAKQEKKAIWGRGCSRYTLFT